MTPAPVYRPVTPAVTYYTVTFDTDGGTEIAAQSVQAGDTAYRPADPEKEGFLFGGWYTDKEYSAEFLFSEPISGDTTVYAKWTEEEPEEVVPEATEELEEPEEPEEPETKSGKPWFWLMLALIIAALGIGGRKLTRQR